MRRLITIALLAVSTISVGQDYNFKPKWKKGDVKEISTSQVEKSFEDDNLISENTTTYEATVKVVNENNEAYTLEVYMENQALRLTTEYYEEIASKLENLSDLKLVYSVHKETGVSELMNWKEAQEFMNGSVDRITNVFEEEAPDEIPVLEMVLGSTKNIFESKESIEEYFENQLGYILLPFCNDFTISKTISKTEKKASFLKSEKEILFTTNITLASIDKKTNTAIIVKEVEHDLSEVIIERKSRMKEIFEPYGLSDKKLQEIDNLDMSIENKQLISFNTKTTWVTKVVKTVSVKGFKVNTESVTTTIVN